MREDYFIYIILCSDNSYYVGSTNNINDRLKRHNEGSASIWTRDRRPVKLVYSEKHDSILDARKRELQIKKWSRKKKENLINNI